MRPTYFYEHELPPGEQIGKGSYGIVSRVEGRDHLVIKNATHSGGGSGPSPQVLKEIVCHHLIGNDEVRMSEDGSQLLMPDLGIDLHQFMKPKYRLKPRHARSITVQILMQLRKLHQLEIYHRDLKPDNIMLVNHNPDQAVLCDFGLAGLRMGQIISHLCCTAWYRSPELNQQHHFYDGRVDVWSMGCILFEMLTGWILFRCHKLDSSDQHFTRAMEFQLADWMLDYPRLMESKEPESWAAPQSKRFYRLLKEHPTLGRLAWEMLNPELASRPTVDECLSKLELVVERTIPMARPMSFWTQGRPPTHKTLESILDTMAREFGKPTRYKIMAGLYAAMFWEQAGDLIVNRSERAYVLIKICASWLVDDVWTRSVHPHKPLLFRKLIESLIEGRMPICLGEGSIQWRILAMILLLHEPRLWHYSFESILSAIHSLEESDRTSYARTTTAGITESPLVSPLSPPSLMGGGGEGEIDLDESEPIRDVGLLVEETYHLLVVLPEWKPFLEIVKYQKSVTPRVRTRTEFEMAPMVEIDLTSPAEEGASPTADVAAPSEAEIHSAHVTEVLEEMIRASIDRPPTSPIIEPPAKRRTPNEGSGEGSSEGSSEDSIAKYAPRPFGGIWLPPRK